MFQIRAIFGYKIYNFFAGPSNGKSVETKFYGSGVNVYEVKRLQKVTFRVFGLHFIFYKHCFCGIFSHIFQIFFFIFYCFHWNRFTASILHQSVYELN